LTPVEISSIARHALEKIQLKYNNCRKIKELDSETMN